MQVLPRSSNIHYFWTTQSLLFVGYTTLEKKKKKSHTHIYFPASGQAVVSGVVSSPLRFLPSIFFAHRVQQSHCSSIILSSVANSRSRAFRKSNCAHEKVSLNFTSMHSGGFELTKLTYTRLEDNLIRHRGDRSTMHYQLDHYVREAALAEFFFPVFFHAE